MPIRSILIVSASVVFLQGQAGAQTEQNRIEQLEQRIDVLEEQLDATAEALEAPMQDRLNQLSIGGYGELHYNNLDAEDSTNDLEEIDFHRFVLFFGWQYTDRLRFYSELELEHSLVGEDAEGELELEQAFIQYDLTDNSSALSGLLLIPVGILNETHEPPTFYGVERNDVESIIIPTTWWAGGALFNQRFGSGLSLDLALHEGLAMSTEEDSAFSVRSGRQKTSEAIASDLAGTLRLKFTGIRGLELAGSMQYQSDPSQTPSDGLDSGILYSAHAIYALGPFGLRALYALWDFEGDAVEAADSDEQSGWYVEPSFRIVPSLGVYARYEDVEGARAQDQFTQWEAGVNYWLHPKVVLKADVRSREYDLEAEQGRDFDGFDLGLGYWF